LFGLRAPTAGTRSYIVYVTWLARNGDCYYPLFSDDSSIYRSSTEVCRLIISAAAASLGIYLFNNIIIDCK